MAAAIPAIPLPLPAPLSTDKLEQRVKFLKTIIRQVEKILQFSNFAQTRATFHSGTKALGVNSAEICTCCAVPAAIGNRA